MVSREAYKDPEVVRRMTRLIAEGAVMLAETCPIDGIPLFKLKNGDVICPVHGKVWVVSSEAEAEEIEIDDIVRRIELYAARKAYQLLNSENAADLIQWLNVIEIAERIRSSRSTRTEKAAQEVVEKPEEKGEGRE